MAFSKVPSADDGSCARSSGCGDASSLRHNGDAGFVGFVDTGFSGDDDVGSFIENNMLEPCENRLEQKQASVVILTVTMFGGT